MHETESETDGGRGTARARVTDTVQALLHGVRRGVPATAAVAQQLGAVQDAAVRAAVAAGLRDELRAALSGVWRRGWQPGHVMHVARRELSSAGTVLLADGVTQELAAYAPSTVDPGWWAQMEELGRASSPSQARQHARGRRDRGRSTTWSALCGDLLTVTVFVERLPSLPVIGPPPGEARPDEDLLPEVDGKLLTRVRRLLAQAEGTPYEAEADTFTAAAQSLMARHRIDRAMLEAEDDRSRAPRGPGAVRLPVDRPYEQPKALLLHVIAAANRCRALWDQPLGLVTVVGHPGDRRAVELLYTSLLVQATAAMRREGERGDDGTRTRGFRSSFLSGFAARVGQRLEEASDAAETEARTRLAGAGVTPEESGAAGEDRMALVLRSRDEEVERLVHELFPHTVRTRSRVVSDAAGWVRGRAAADRADLGAGGRLTDGAA
ncbi:DUF2786 domain-containing protein [Ornithinimicrobium pekingense]|uniref:DUF2786 domain-containing protein n=1 Tax=Ornithinimicrobium pekingense TaxID=384677 RepID=A0ABQ2F655_9MICO|nr:DUF2786 domain-containing protein [Ornithinimicrobium pekingense]GGK65818.1 hypothetical protein GCM10011509_12660 [Ornithinimicrobium pekingense]